MPEIVIEKFLNGKSADVGQMTASGWVAWEVQLENSVRDDLLRDLLQKDLRSGFIRVVVCVQSRKDMQKVNAVVAEMAADPQFADLENINEKVSAQLLAAYLERSKEV